MLDLHRAVFAIHKRRCLQREKRQRQRLRASAAKRAWQAERPDLILKQAAARLLEQHQAVVVYSSGDEACSAALDEWEDDGRQ